MFEVGFTELLLIFALALLVLGPQKLPKLAQQVGRWVGRARAMARQFREQLEEEAHSLETKMSIDPEIDTSLEARRDTPATPATPAASTAATVPAATPEPQDVEEEFYPPDHHMHPSQRGASATEGVEQDDAAAPAAETLHDTTPGNSARQGELDLTDDPGSPKAP